jgi:hypothetical protein
MVLEDLGRPCENIFNRNTFLVALTGRTKVMFTKVSWIYFAVKVVEVQSLKPSSEIPVNGKKTPVLWKANETRATLVDLASLVTGLPQNMAFPFTVKLQSMLQVSAKNVRPERQQLSTTSLSVHCHHSLSEPERWQTSVEENSEHVKCHSQ